MLRVGHLGNAAAATARLDDVTVFCFELGFFLVPFNFFYNSLDRRSSSLYVQES